MLRGNHAGPILPASEPLLRENDSMIVCQLAWNKLVVEPREAYNGRGTPRWNSIYLQIYIQYIFALSKKTSLKGNRCTPTDGTRPEISRQVCCKSEPPKWLQKPIAIRRMGLWNSWKIHVDECLIKKWSNTPTFGNCVVSKGVFRFFQTKLRLKAEG